MAGQATFPAVPDVTKIEFLQSIAGPFGGVKFQYELYWRDAVNTHDYAYLSQLASDAALAWSDTAGPIDLVSNDVTLDAVRCTDLDALTHLSATDPVGIVGTGGTSAVLPLTVCAVVRIPNAEGGAPRSPYIRFAPVQEAQVAGNTINPSDRVTIADTVQVVTDFLATAQPDGELVVISVYEPKASGGGTPATLYRATGLVKLAAAASFSTRPLVGRAASRQQ